MHKPPKEYCKRFCPEYATCTKTECDKRPIFYHGVRTIMVSKELADELDLRYRRREYFADLTTRKGSW